MTDKALVDVILSLRRLTRDAETLLRNTVGIPSGAARLNFSYVDCRWEAPRNTLRIKDW